MYLNVIFFCFEEIDDKFDPVTNTPYTHAHPHRHPLDINVIRNVHLRKTLFDRLIIPKTKNYKVFFRFVLFSHRFFFGIPDRIDDQDQLCVCVCQFNSID